MHIAWNEVHSFGASQLRIEHREWEPHFGSGRRVLSDVPNSDCSESAGKFNSSALFSVGAFVLMSFVLGRTFKGACKHS